MKKTWKKAFIIVLGVTMKATAFESEPKKYGYFELIVIIPS